MEMRGVEGSMTTRRSFLQWLGVAAVAAPVAAKAAEFHGYSDGAETYIVAGPKTGFITGDIIQWHNHNPIAGFVRLNGRTIGAIASGASERASQDTKDLYRYLWENLDDSVAWVNGGRGSKAELDFRANKAIQLFDYRPNNYFLKL
jgi:hypothetical protein